MPAVVAASLTNDLFSYEKEYEAAQNAGLTDVVNALWVLMGEHDISLAEAKAMCRRRIKEEVAKYACVVKETRLRDDLSSEAKRYIELMQYSVSGNVIWSLQCPRYHKDIQYNQQQILRATEGVAKHPSTYRLVESHGGCYDRFQNVCSTGASDIQHQNANEYCDWDLFASTRGTALHELGEEVGVTDSGDITSANLRVSWYSSLIVMSARYRPKAFETWLLMASISGLASRPSPQPSLNM